MEQLVPAGRQVISPISEKSVAAIERNGTVVQMAVAQRLPLVGRSLVIAIVERSEGMAPGVTRVEHQASIPSPAQFDLQSVVIRIRVGPLVVQIRRERIRFEEVDRIR